MWELTGNHVFILFFFLPDRPTDPPSREGGQWEVKHFIGMAVTQSQYSWTAPQWPAGHTHQLSGIIRGTPGYGIDLPLSRMGWSAYLFSVP